jgi:hypothetical protein
MCKTDSGSGTWQSADFREDSVYAKHMDEDSRSGLERHAVPGSWNLAS